MTATSSPAASDTPVASPPAATAGVWSRLSDRLNPILVREVQQAVTGRVFLLTILLALVISVVIAAVVASDYRDGGSGRSAFVAGLATLAPLLLFVIPMQAYNSMRTELKGGIVEQLLLTRLTPGAVLAGKLQAAMVQFVLYVSVMSPLLATSYLLRGVDLATIAISMLFALVACVSATAFAVSSAAQAVVPALQPIANLGIAFGLGMGTFGAVGAIVSGGYTAGVGMMLRSRELPMILSGILLASSLATTVSWLAARVFLLHAFENKSTAFRVFLFTLPVWAYGWMLAFLDPSDWRWFFPGVTFALLLAGVVFGIFMVTEQRRLSPRVWAHVPATGWRARLLAPLLPGHDRGLLCFALYGGLLVVVSAVVMPQLAPMSGRFSPQQVLLRAGPMTLGYALLYLGIGRWLRARLPDTVQANHAGRFVLPVVMFLFLVVPALVDVVVRGEVRSWHIGHAMNPFWTIEHFIGSRWQSVEPLVYAAIGVLALLHVPAWRRGLAEIRSASAKRRARLTAAAGASSGPDAAPSPGSAEAAGDGVEGAPRG